MLASRKSVISKALTSDRGDSLCVMGSLPFVMPQKYVWGMASFGLALLLIGFVAKAKPTRTQRAPRKMIE